MNRKFIAAGIDGAPTTDFNPFNAAQHRCSAGRSILNPREQTSRNPR